jgi:hypothetical protein
VPEGSEFQVNTYTTSSQSGPSVAADADGDFVVVWDSFGSSGSDSSSRSVQGQRYDSAGGAVGSEFQVNTYTTGYQFSASVAADGDGDFVVAWTSEGSSGSDSSSRSVQGQRFSVEPEPLEVEIDVKPGAVPNPIKLSRKAVVAVAILSTDTPSFDAATVDASSVCFGDAEDESQRDCTEAHGTGHLEDVDLDLDLDLHYKARETGIDAGDTEACLGGETTGGDEIEGCDSVAPKP